jgi:hypothetical protein
LIESEGLKKIGNEYIEMQNFNFFKTSMPNTRKADFYLGCLDSSVFIDFNKLESGQVSIVRISFDGFGCCNLKAKGEPLNIEESELFLHQMKVDIIDQKIIATLVGTAIRMNKEQIWIEALEKYKLI